MTPAPGEARHVELQVLGPVRLSVSGDDVRLSELERGFLAAAALHRHLTTAVVIAWLWDDDPPASARNRVQALVSGLRRKAGAAVLVTEGSGYRLGEHVAVDLHAWTAAIDDIRARLPEGTDHAARADALGQALARFDGEPLGGISATAAAEMERDRLTEQRLVAVEEHLAARIESGQLRDTCAELGVLTADHPYRESLLALHVLCLGASGRQAQALDVYRDARRRLIDELGVEPSSALQEAHRRVLQGDLPGQATAVTGTAPTATPAAPRVLPVPRTSPRPPTGFVGREDSLRRLADAALQAADEPVVVSVTGISGSGTSALVATAASRLRDTFPDGTLYADLAGLGADDGVHSEVGTFLRLLGILPEVVPDEPVARVGLLRSVLDGRRVLVVLDNVDHHDGRPNTHLGDLLPTSPGSMAVITSRSSIAGLQPTTRLRLGSLDAAEARDLLAHVAGPDRIDREPDATAELVRRSGGLPLALRLVGSRLADRPDYSVAALAHRLTDGATGPVEADPGAGVQLSRSLELVWDRLEEPTRRAACQLAHLPVDVVSAWVPSALLGSDLAGDVALEAMLDASFVEPVQREGRLTQYRLHDVVRRFALGRDDVPGVDPAADLQVFGTALLRRLVAHHGDVPEQFLPPPPCPGGATETGVVRELQPDLVIATELASARTAAVALAEQEPATAWRLLFAAENARQMAADDEDWPTAVEVVRKNLDPDDRDASLGIAALDLAHAWYLQDALGHATRALDVALDTRRRLTDLGTPVHAAAASLVAAYAAVSLGDRATADRELATATSLLGPDDPVLRGWSLVVRGELGNDFDELEACEADLSLARETLSPTRERIGYARATVYLSRVCRRLGRLEEARTLADEALDEFARHGAERSYTVALDARAEIGVELGDGAAAYEQADSALRRAETSCDAFLAARSRRTRARAIRVLGRLDEAESELRRCLELFALLDRPLSVAVTERDLAEVLALR